MLRRSLIAVLAAALLAAGPAAAARYTAPAGSGALFLFSGHGWGHGVGMSQYGAYGYAQHGWTYDRILAHYYPGTKLGRAPVTTIRVLLADRRKALTISSEAPPLLTDGLGAVHTLGATTVKLGVALKLAVDGQPARALPPPLTLRPADGSTLSLGRAYRGRILVDVVDGRLRAIDVVGLEQYLDGVVPAEMPSTWSTEALEAQAVAARSYALSTRQVAAPFDVYADTRSQLYLGVDAEKPATSEAVAATAGQVLFYGTTIAKTYFSSTSGGRTEAAADVWLGQSLPYLVSVPDPYDAISPFHDWGPVPVPARTVAQRLAVPGRIVDARTTRNPAGRAATFDVSSLQGTNPVTVTSVPGTAARSELGLRSTWFDVGVLALLPPTKTAPVPFGTTVRLSGLVRGVDGVVVEQRNVHLPWQTLTQVKPDAGGAITVVAKPAITTDYRLATADAAAAYVRIRVTPSVKITSATRTTVSGAARPTLPGATVVIQKPSPSGRPAWTTVARGTVDARGAFSVPVSLPTGSVRAVVAPGHGYWPGASAAATVA
jgi:SpoIID/LytB domain protein